MFAVFLWFPVVRARSPKPNKSNQYRVFPVILRWRKLWVFERLQSKGNWSLKPAERNAGQVMICQFGVPVGMELGILARRSFFLATPSFTD